jgi:hypothetical protein
MRERAGSKEIIMPRAPWVPLCVAIFATILGIIPTEAAAKNWNDGTASWSPGVWSPSGAPVGGEAVNIVFTDGTPRTVTLNVSPPSLGLLSVDLTGAGTDVSTLSMPNSTTLAANGILFGGYNGATTTAGRGAGIQSGGTTVSTNSGWDFVLGYGANSTGTYMLSGTGALTANQSEYIGLFGNGTFTQSAATNTLNSAGGFFEIGEAAGSTGTYNLSGTGTLTVKCNEYVGDVGTGVFNQDGGTHSIDTGTNLYIGYGAGGTGGTYTLNAGTLSVNKPSAVAGEHVGYKVSGTFNQNGGTNQIWGTGLHVGTLSGSTGIYTMTAGTCSSNGGEIIGESGTGTFTQTGGDNGTGAGTGVFIGYNANSVGTYNLSGTGSFGSGFDMYVGYNGAGTFNQNGGTAGVAENLVIGFAATAAGSAYNLTAGSFSQGFSTYVTAIGNGTFNQSGGTSTFSGGGVNVNGGSASVGNFIVSGGTATTTDIAIASNGVLTVSGSGVLTVTDTSNGSLSVTTGTTNAIHLSGGTINTPSLNFDGNPAALNWTSGTLHITQNVRWNNSANPTATADAFGFGLALGSNQTLVVTGDEYLGGDVPFVLTLNAGSAHNVSGTLVVDVTGTIAQNAGSTLYAGAIIQAGGTVNGTLQNQTTFTYQSGSFNGRLLNQGTAVLGLSFTAGNGIENDASMTVNLGQTFTLNGQGLDNRGDFTLAGGTLNGNGPLVNNSALTGHGTLAGTGGFTNNALLTVGGGTMALSNLGANANVGEIDVPGGYQLQLTGGNLTNTGAINLIAGTISGSATLNNSAGGIISGHGTISSPLSNLGTISVDSGILNITTAFTNAGELYLAGGVATLNGAGTLFNGGLLRGDGVINKLFTNNSAGEIRAENGKRIKLTGVNGNNTGLINLQGGTVEFSQSLFNATMGQIVGRGLLKVGGTGLLNNGQIELSGGLSDFQGSLTNNTGAKVIVTGGSTATFYNGVACNTGSEFRVSTGSTAVFFGNVTGTSTFTGSGTKDFEGGSSSLAGAVATPGDTIVASSAHLTVDAIRENSLSVDGLVTIRPNGTSAGTSVVSALVINGGGKLDLNDNNLIVHNGNLVTIAAQLKSGLNASGTLWTGTGIQSSTAAADAAAHSNATVFAVGAIKNIDKNGNLIYSTWPAAPSPDSGASGLTATDVLVKYTYFGDADLNGVVDNTTDYDLWSNGFTNPALAATNGWLYGDFDFSGVVDNTTDYDLWSTGFAHQGGALAGGSPTNVSSTGLSDVQSVPEPSALVMAALGFIAIARIARRRGFHRRIAAAEFAPIDALTKKLT